MSETEVLRRAAPIERTIERAGALSIWVALERALGRPMLGPRIKTFLLNERIETVEDLFDKQLELFHAPNLGRRSWEAMNADLNKIGLHLRGMQCP